MNMQIVVNIDEETYNDIKKGKIYSSFRDVPLESVNAIANGIPLPKGHGDLIDRSKICKAIPAEEDNCTGMGMTYDEMDAYNDGIDVMYSLIQGTPTIIEADKQEEHE